MASSNNTAESGVFSRQEANVEDLAASALIEVIHPFFLFLTFLL